MKRKTTSLVRKKKAPSRRPRARTAPRSGDATRRIDEWIAGLDDWRGELLAKLRQMIQEANPDVVEDWKWRGAPVWSHEGMYAVGNAHKDKVKITFFHGARLRDPRKLFNAGLGGGQWRAIDLYEGDAIDAAAFKALVREAVSFNTKNSVPKSKRSRA